MKKTIITLAAVAAFISSCSKTATIPGTIAITRNTLNADTISFSQPEDITYTSRCTDPLTTVHLSTKGAVIGTEINIIVPTTSGTMLNFTADPSIKQVLLTNENGAYSLGATYSTRWIITLKYFSPDYIEALITNPKQI